MTNINVTPGTGKTVATETVGGVEYGLVKLIDGLAGSSTPLTFQGGAIPVSIQGTIPTHSVAGTVGASVIGTAPVTQAGVWVTSVVGIVTVSSVTGSVLPYAQPDSFVSAITSVITGTASIQVLGTPGSALRNYITHILVTNAATSATQVNIVDAGNIIYSGYAAGSGGGFSATLPVPLKQTSTNLGLFAHTPTQASIYVALVGYKAA